MWSWNVEGEGEEPLVGSSKSSISLYISVIFIIVCVNHSMQRGNYAALHPGDEKSISLINDTTAMIVILEDVWHCWLMFLF